MTLTRAQIWLAGAFLVTILNLANTWFVEGQLQIFLYIVIAICFAFFVIVMVGNKKKNGADV